MAQWGRPGTELGNGFFGAYDYPDWYREYLRLTSTGEAETEGVDIRELYVHVLENWSSYVVPDLLRFFPRLPADDEAALLTMPWRFLREVILSLFGIPESLTGGTFARAQRTPEEGEA